VGDPWDPTFWKSQVNGHVNSSMHIIVKPQIKDQLFTHVETGSQESGLAPQEVEGLTCGCILRQQGEH